jgi:hypothetical protein
MSKGETKKKPGCLQRLMVGLGCGCLYPTVIFIFLIGLSWFYLAEAYSQITTPVKLPEFSGPAQQDFWSLQEKRLARQDAPDSFITLSESEINAFLAMISLPPKQGYFLHRLRFKPQKEQGRLFLIGSGFFLRSLVFTLEISVDEDSRPVIKGLAINSWQVKPQSLAWRQTLKYLQTVFNEKTVKELQLLNSQKFKIELQDQKIKLPDFVIKKQVLDSPDQ